MSNEQCEHRNFSTKANVARLEDSGGFLVDIIIECSDCKSPFVFLGLPYGLNMQGAAMSPDGTEARLAIRPQREEKRPLLSIKRKRCPSCSSLKVEMFEADNGFCKTCEKWFAGT